MKTVKVVAAIIHRDGKIFATARGYGDFKSACGEVCADALAPVQSEYARLMADKGYLESIMQKGAEEANYCARKTLSKVKKKIGFVV